MREPPVLSIAHGDRRLLPKAVKTIARIWQARLAYMAHTGELLGWYQTSAMPPINARPTGVKIQYGSFLQCVVCTLGKSLVSISFHVRKISTSCAQMVPTL